MQYSRKSIQKCRKRFQNASIILIKIAVTAVFERNAIIWQLIAVIIVSSVQLQLFIFF